MDLPVFRRGLELVSSQLNKLSNAVRASTITSVVGGTLSSTPGGTTLVIGQQPITSGGGSAAPCPFKVTDVSLPNPSGSGQMTLKLNVKCEYIRAYDVWPLGTSAEFPNHVIPDIPEQEGWYGIYLWIQLDQEGNLLKENDVVVRPEVAWIPRWVESTSTDFYVYLAGVNVSTDSANNKYISSIENACPLIQKPTLPTCRFMVEPVTKLSGSGVSIQIRSGRINGAYPTGMDATTTYELPVNDTATNYWYLYCVMVVSNGQIQTGPNDITFGLYDNQKTSTDVLVYFLIAEIQTGYDEAGDRTIEYIYNYCQQPFAIPMTACPFRLTDASEGTTQQIEVAFGYIDNFVPHGMPVPPATTPPLLIPITGKSYIYCKMTYSSSNFAIQDRDSIVFTAETTTKSNTSLDEYVLVGTVDWENDKIKSISNVCQSIVPNPCNLAWNTPA